MHYAGDLIAGFGSAFDAHVHHFPVPAFFDYAETKRAMWRERSVRRVLDVQHRADIALFSVGAVAGGVPSHVYSAGYLDPDDVAVLDAEGVVGDVCTVFLRADGTYRDIALNERATGPAPEELRRVPRRVCAVAGTTRWHRCARRCARGGDRPRRRRDHRGPPRRGLLRPGAQVCGPVHDYAPSGSRAYSVAVPTTSAVRVRPALPADVRAVRALVQPYAEDRILLAKEMVGYYEAVQEFVVAEVPDPDAADGEDVRRVVGCGALHVMWDDLAEIRTLAVDPAWRGYRVGHALVVELVARARALGLRRVFCLTFEVDFFRAHGFRTIEGTPVSPRCTPSSCARTTTASRSSSTSRA